MGSELDPAALFSMRSDWRGHRQPLDVAINASASAAAGVEVAAAEAGVEVAAVEADGASRGGGDGGGGGGHESQPSCVRQRL